MTSSMLSGERRWASSRRGGMTVLGKVAVPKPINLPSQRLENHGLDPNVEIVPKGTLSWGSRSSSSTSNAWGSSLSPNTDGTSSPSHLSARPSSGGSGTRPSTAGSDRAAEPTANSYSLGSNSRPSSASGVPSTNQSSLASLRPRSAETRPASSHLSRFAESLTENSVAWNAARTTEKLGQGVTQLKNEEFSLSSGDFPSLGSDKDKSVLNSELQDHSSQAHADLTSELSKEINETPVIDDIPVNANIKGGTVNSWRRDHQVYNEEGPRPGMEKWQGNSQPYPAGIPPQHYDAWHGPPVNNPQGCVWFRGPPTRPPFGNPVTPSGFPIEPLQYYHPHMPPTGLVNPPPVPPPGAGQRGQHKNGDVYRPHMPDAFIRPGIPIRPGFFPGSMSYDGYYRSPMGYCNPNERDVPFMGMAAGPPVYNRYSNQNPAEHSNSQGRSGGYSAGKQLTSEQVEPSHPPDAARPYRVLLKQHESYGKNEQTNRDDSEASNTTYDGRTQPKVTVWENEQRSNYRKNEEMDLRTSTGGEVSSQTSENQVSNSVIKAKFPESSGSIRNSDVASDILEILPNPSAPKDASLIQKIEGLNAKARDNSSVRIREEKRNKFHAGKAPINHVENAVGADVVFPARTHTTEIINPALREIGAAGAEKNIESLSFCGTASSRQTHGMQGRGEHRNKVRSTNQDADGWQKKSVVENSSASSGAQFEASNVLVGDHQISVQAYDRSGSYNQVRHIGESVQTRSDAADSHAQRAKMKELAKQRTKQLQEEEEERTRKQKAKALAKLDELNKRSLAGDGSTQKEYASNSAVQNKLEELQPSESTTAAGKFAPSSSAVNCNANTICQINDPSISEVEKPLVLSGEPTVETVNNSGKEHVLNHSQAIAMHQDISSVDATNALHVHNNVTSKQKRMNYKQKQNLPLEKTSSEKVVSTTTSTALKVENDTRVESSGVITNEVGSAFGSDLHMNLAVAVESSANLKKKNIRNSKNKQKHEESSSQAALPLTVPKETNLSKGSVEIDKSKTSDIELYQGSLQPASLSKDPNQLSEQHRYLSNDESHGRMNSQWKSQHSRRMPRNMQTNRLAEKSHGTDAVMWAPVKPQNKNEIMGESSEKSKIETVNPLKSEQQVHNLKNKRAEMERYIPKPVAKELAQQGNIQLVSSSSSQAPTDDCTGRVNSGSQGTQVIQHTNNVVGKVGSEIESKNRDSRHAKQGKTYGSWRQRNLTESINVHEVQEGLNHDSNTGPNVHRSTEHHHDQKSEVSFVKGQTKHINNSGDVDGSNNSNNDSAALASAVAIKDHAARGRGRRAPLKGQKSAGGNCDVDNEKNYGEDEKIETHISFSEHGQLDVGAASKENQGVGERLTSQWQPKSQASNNHQGNVSSDQNVCSVAVGANKKDLTHDGESLLVSRDKRSNAHVSQPFHDQSVSEKSKAGEASHFGNLEGKRERKSAPSKRHHYSPSQVSVTSVEQAPSADFLHDQRPSFGSGKNANQNRFRRGHESVGDLKPPTHDNRHYNQPTNRERQGPNSHFEYHPIGPYDDGKSDNFERPKNGNHGGGRYRERGQTQSRRGGGNSYGHQGGFESFA